MLGCYDENGELDERLFAELTDEMEDKVGAIGFLVAERAGWAATARAEAKRQLERAAAFDRDGSRLTDRAHDLLLIMGVRKVTTGTATASLRKQPLRTVIVDEAAIPETYRRSVVVESIDKKAIATAIDADVDVPGATRERGDDRLQWK
jgi:hypothetical protein